MFIFAPVGQLSILTLVVFVTLWIVKRYKKVKQSRYRPGVAQRVSGS